MERGRGAVETDIGRDGRLPGERVQRLGLGDLMDEAPAGENVEEIGLVGAHRSCRKFQGKVAACRGAAGVTGPPGDSNSEHRGQSSAPKYRAKMGLRTDPGLLCH